MPIAFLDFAQACPRIVTTDILAGVVSLESGFDPMVIRMTGSAPLSWQAASSSEAVKVAPSLAGERRDIRLGLDGIGMEQLSKLNLTISGAFDPCCNLQATTTRRDGDYCVAVEAGADPNQAEQAMPQFHDRQGNLSVGATVQYGGQVRREVTRLGKTLATVVFEDDGKTRGLTEESPIEFTVETATSDRAADQTVSGPAVGHFQCATAVSRPRVSEQPNGAERMTSTSRIRPAATSAAIAIAIVATQVEPAFAQAAGIETVLQNIVDMLTGNIAKLLAVIAVIVICIAWMFGYMDLRRAGFWIIGIGGIFGATELVNTVVGS